MSTDNPNRGRPRRNPDHTNTTAATLAGVIYHEYMSDPDRVQRRFDEVVGNIAKLLSDLDDVGGVGLSYPHETRAHARQLTRAYFRKHNLSTGEQASE